MGIYRDTYTVSRQPDGRWRAVMHGFKQMEFFGATASEALANAGKVTDFSAEAIDRFERRISAVVDEP